MSAVQMPNLQGACCLIGDAESLVGRTVQADLLSAGSTVIALRQRRPGGREVRTHRSTTVPQTMSVSVDLQDCAEIDAGLAWAMHRCGRLDAAVITDEHGVYAMLDLATYALTHLALTARFTRRYRPQLLCLAQPRSHAVAAMTAASQQVPFVDQVDIQVIEAWPDAHHWSIAAVRAALHEMPRNEESPGRRVQIGSTRIVLRHALEGLDLTEPDLS
jgi:hypothetical protein